METEGSVLAEMDREGGSPEDIEKDWLSLPEAEQEAYRTKAMAYMAEAVRSAYKEGKPDYQVEKEAWQQRNDLLFHGEVEGVEPSKEDYALASTAIDSLKTDRGGSLIDRLGNLAANAQMDLLAMQMMRRDRKSL